jgi:hypothetical protein
MDRKEKRKFLIAEISVLYGLAEVRVSHIYWAFALSGRG